MRLFHTEKKNTELSAEPSRPFVTAVIVAAGNPPEYNRSVRDFDMVTLDRIRKIDI